MSSPQLPVVYLVRHGETAWSLSGQHTGRTDIALTPNGEKQALSVAPRLRDLQFTSVYTSPLSRARRTCELAGFGDQAVADDDLMEWHYGDYEGLTSKEILAKNPQWYLFRDGFPGGESVEEIGARAQRFVARLKAGSGNLLVFSHGHMLRFVAASWLNLASSDARIFTLSTASLSILGFDHNSLDEPVIKLWNDDSHMRALVNETR